MVIRCQLQVEVIAKQTDGSNGSMSMTISNPKINK